MTKKESFFRWYQENEDKLKTLSSHQVGKLFAEKNDNFLTTSSARTYTADIRNGKLTEEYFASQKPPDPESFTKLAEKPEQPITFPTQPPPPKTLHYKQEKFKVLIFSDCHGWLADLRALRCINKVLQKNHFDEVVINGDLIDMPFISKHTQKLYTEGILKGYTEVGEIEYTKDQILKPLRLSTSANIRIRLGNHCERITKPNLLSDKQLQKLAIVYKNYQTTKLDEMLGITKEDGYIYDPADVHTYFDKFTLVHGLSLANNASEKNIQEYMSSGSSGHTHRLGVYIKTNRKAPYAWLQSGHTRVGEEVEYFPTGKIPNWQQGFNVVTFYRHDGEMFFHWEVCQIIDGRTMYSGEFYSG